MSRLDFVTIAIVAVCLAALGYLVYKIVNMMNPQEETTTSVADTYGDNASTDPDLYTGQDENVGDDEDLDDEDLSASDIAQNETGAGNAPSTVDASELDNTDDEFESTPATTTPSRSSSGVRDYDSEASSTGAAGKYMVIVGSYSQKANAEAMASRLKKMGYDDAEVRIFDRGSFARVLVARYSSITDARALANELKNKGVQDVIVQE